MALIHIFALYCMIKGVNLIMFVSFTEQKIGLKIPKFKNLVKLLSPCNGFLKEFSKILTHSQYYGDTKMPCPGYVLERAILLVETSNDQVDR